MKNNMTIITIYVSNDDLNYGSLKTRDVEFEMQE
jgi:hypothetical protein